MWRRLHLLAPCKHHQGGDQCPAHIPTVTCGSGRRSPTQSLLGLESPEAPVAQGIEQWPPEPCAQVRILPGAHGEGAPRGLLLHVTPHAGFEEEPRRAGRRSPAGGTNEGSPLRAAFVRHTPCRVRGGAPPRGATESCRGHMEKEPLAGSFCVSRLRDAPRKIREHSAHPGALDRRRTAPGFLNCSRMCCGALPRAYIAGVASPIRSRPRVQ